MSADGVAKTWGDPYALVREATSYHDNDKTLAPPGEAGVKNAIRQAHQLISPDLYVIERLKQSHVEPDYENLFGDQFQQKLAALIFLTKHKLLDIEQSALESRDITDARRDLSNFVEIIFRMKIVDALKIFYDFAEAQHESRVPWLWHNVCSRCLYLMSLLTDCRASVVDFLKDRPEACNLMDDLQRSTKPEISSSLGALAQDYQLALRSVEGPAQQALPAPMPLFVSLVQQYEAQAPASMGRDSAARGVSSLLSAQDRISEAAAAGDTSSLVDWISHGSPAAMHTVFRTALSAMTTTQYISLLKQSITQGRLDQVRMTAVALELGSINRSTHPQGGDPAVNQLLLQLSLLDDAAYNGVAKVAVHEFGSVHALNILHTVMEKTPLLEVAEEVVVVMRELRHLPMVETLLKQRPELAPAFRTARQELLELQELVDAVSSCQSKEMALIYLDQLKKHKAVPELKQLMMAQNFVHEIAQSALDEIQADSPWAK